MKLGVGEPAAGPWRVESPSGLMRLLRTVAPAVTGRPLVVAIDGRGGSGKTTVANALHDAIVTSTVVHTDDVSWHHSFFGWTDLLVAGVLDPVRRGHPVAYRPPAWDEHSRNGSIDVTAGLDVVFVEGVGAARRGVMHLLDAVIWVQSDAVAAERRGIARDGGDEAATAFWHEWMQEEEPLLDEDRPWERADVIVAGTETGVQAPPGHLVIAAR
jgi:hypothetical protein